MSAAHQSLRVAVLTISDSVARGTREDRSGKSLAARCQELGWMVVALEVMPDDRATIEAALVQACDSNNADVVLTTGGTGLGPRDVTPEATETVVDRLIPGFPELMRSSGGAITKRAWLSRATAGIRGKTIVVNLPGSPGGAQESIDAITDLLPHAVEVLRGARHD